MYSKYFIIWTIDKLLVLLLLKTVLDGISQKTGVGMNLTCNFFIVATYLQNEKFNLGKINKY